MNKRKIAEMFGVTHEVNDLQNQVEILASKVAHYEVKLEDVQRELDFYKLEDEEKVMYLMEDVMDIENLYKERIKEYEDLIALEKATIDGAEEKIHRAFHEGRYAAYSEMGIWRLDALKDGNRLVMDKDGNVFELLEVEDVKGSGEDIDEIRIGDLT